MEWYSTAHKTEKAVYHGECQGSRWAPNRRLRQVNCQNTMWPRFWAQTPPKQKPSIRCIQGDCNVRKYQTLLYMVMTLGIFGVSFIQDSGLFHASSFF